MTPAAPARKRLWMLGALWLAVAVVLVIFRGEVLPFAAAALIAYIMAPLVNRLARVRVGRRTFPRWSSVLVVYAIFFLAVYLFVIALVPQLYREIAHVSKGAAEWANSLTPSRIQELAERTEAWLTDHGLPVSLSRRSIEGAEDGTAAPISVSVDLEQLIHDTAARASALLKTNAASLLQFSRGVITVVVATVFGLFFMLMLAAFITIDSQPIRAWAKTLIPPELAADAAVLIARIDRSLAGVVRGQLTICVVNGTLTFIGLVIFGVKFAFLLATVAMVFALIPIFGTILSSIPIVLIAVTQSWHKGLAMLIWILGIHALEAYFLNPKIMGTAAKIHPVVMAFALIAGERTYGLIGALLAPPVAAILVACFEFLREKAQRVDASEAVAAEKARAG